MSLKDKISTGEDIQYYLNELQSDEFNPLIVRSDNYEEGKKEQWVKLKNVDEAVAELKKDIKEMKGFGFLEDEPYYNLLGMIEKVFEK